MQLTAGAAIRKQFLLQPMLTAWVAKILHLGASSCDLLCAFQACHTPVRTLY
jgi:hypothetical protein